jgi:hypothetical protein
MQKGQQGAPKALLVQPCLALKPLLLVGQRRLLMLRRRKGKERAKEVVARGRVLARAAARARRQTRHQQKGQAQGACHSRCLQQQ